MRKVNYVLRSARRMKAIMLLFCTLMLCSVAGHAQQLTVKGTVSDSAGEPLPSASVVVAGKAGVGTTTDINGNYSIKVDAKASLVFSFIGMKSETVAVKGRSSIDVTLDMADDMLNEVVVVGYGTQKKSSMTSAVSAIKGDELLKGPSTNISQLLGGKLPGITSLQESGEPGVDQAALKIRGSAYGVSYVVDGYPVRDINDIDPQDIESVSVLKDGASAAVYGLQSAGGVIIITTKRGQQGKNKVTYNGQFGVSLNANFPDFMNGPQFAYYYNMAQMMDQLASGAIKNRNEYDPYFTKQNVEDMLAGRNGFGNVNYIDKVFGTGFNMKHNVTVQGGNEKSNYFASVGYLDQKGNIDNFNYRRYNLRINLDTKFAKNWQLKLGVSGVVGRRDTPYFSSGGADNGYEEAGFLSIANQTIMMHPYLPERDEATGLYTATIKKNTQAPQSPLAAIHDSGWRKNRSFEGSANFELSYNVPWVKGLTLKVNGSYNNLTTKSRILATLYNVMAYSNGTYVQMTDPRGTEKGNTLNEGQSNYESLVGQASINYTNSFGKHNVNALLLGELRDNSNDGLYANGKNLQFVQLPYLDYTTADGNSGGAGASRSAGYVFRLSYNYDNRYLAEFTGRYDGSYKFYGMSGKQWGFFPSGSIGWRMSNEEFMKDITWLSDLKLRASVGLLGTDSGLYGGIGEYMFLATYAPGGKVLMPTWGTGSPTTGNTLYVNKIPNLELGWEKTLSYNVGFDVTLWNGLLGAEIDGFYNYTYDILTNGGSDKPASMGGFYPSTINNNAMDTKGIDILLTHRNTLRVGDKPLTYNVGFTLTYAKTRWLKYPDKPNDQEWRKVVGTTYGSMLVWKADGLFRSEEEIDNSAWYGSRPCVGDIKYVDINGDGKIDEDDRGYFGRSNHPQLTYGLNLGASWNGFDFNAQFTGGALFDVSMTGTYYNGYDDNSIWTQTFKEYGNSPLYLVQNAYSIDNPNGTFPRLTLGATGHGGDNGLASTFWNRNGNYLRLKTAQLGYTLPSSLMHKIGLESLRIYIEGSNLFTIDGLPEGIDPESPQVNNGYYPQQRTVMGGITLTF